MSRRRHRPGRLSQHIVGRLELVATKTSHRHRQRHEPLHHLRGNEQSKTDLGRHAHSVVQMVNLLCWRGSPFDFCHCAWIYIIWFLNLNFWIWPFTFAYRNKLNVWPTLYPIVLKSVFIYLDSCSFNIFYRILYVCMLYVCLYVLYVWFDQCIKLSFTFYFQLLHVRWKRIFPETF